MQPRSFQSHVLVAADDASCGELVCRLLYQLGVSTVLVGDGTAALNYLAETPWVSCAVLDITMPGLSGSTVAWTLAARRPELPVVMMSGSSKAEIRASLGGLTVAGILTKPFGLPELTALMAPLLPIGDR